MNWMHVLWQAPYAAFRDLWAAVGTFLYDKVFGFIYARSWNILWVALGDTLYMIVITTVVSYLLGLALGVLLVITRKDGIKPMPRLNAVVGAVTNFLRSIPFVILLASLIEITFWATGKMTGTVPILPPLIISAFPYVARMVEGSLLEVDGGVVEAAKAMGSSTWQIIHKVLLPEAMPSLINGAAISMTTILGYTTMASVISGGGLGAQAVIYGLNQHKYDIMYAAAIMLVVLVQIITVTGTILSRKHDHRLR